MKFRSTMVCLAVMLLAGATVQAMDANDDVALASSIPASVELVQIDEEVALLEADTVNSTGSISAISFACFGLDCPQWPPGTLCNPILHCHCSFPTETTPSICF